MPAVTVELVLMIVWSLAAIGYLVIRERRWRIERKVLSDVCNTTHAELVKMHERCARGEKERTRILCAVHKFQHANPKLADAIDNALGEDAN
jgi:hypothetical protein